MHSGPARRRPGYRRRPRRREEGAAAAAAPRRPRRASSIDSRALRHRPAESVYWPSAAEAAARLNESASPGREGVPTRRRGGATGAVAPAAGADARLGGRGARGAGLDAAAVVPGLGRGLREVVFPVVAVEAPPQTGPVPRIPSWAEIHSPAAPR